MTLKGGPRLSSFYTSLSYTHQSLHLLYSPNIFPRDVLTISEKIIFKDKNKGENCYLIFFPT